MLSVESLASPRAGLSDLGIAAEKNLMRKAGTQEMSDS
jgi:hypothetical protein